MPRVPNPDIYQPPEYPGVLKESIANLSASFLCIGDLQKDSVLNLIIRRCVVGQALVKFFNLEAFFLVEFKELINFEPRYPSRGVKLCIILFQSVW